MSIYFRFLVYFILSVSTVATPQLQSLRLYSGVQDNGISVGQSLSVSLFDSLVLYTDFESYLQSFEGSYFSPSLLDYKLGIALGQFAWEHSCVHQLDNQASAVLPIRDRFSWSW